MEFYLVLFCLSVASASVSRQIQLGDTEYFVPPTAAWKLESWDSDDEFTPLTVIHLNGTPNAARVATVLNKYQETDDVWTPSFAQVLYFQSDSRDNKWLKDLPPKYNVSTAYYDSETSTSPGPYFVHRDGDVYQAYRLYPDTNQAFLQSSYQDPSGTHHPLRAATFSAAGLTIAVPSRLYYTPTPDKPLAGVRIAVKDLYDLKGLKTSGGNRALYEISEVKNETAAAVQKLINAGAIIVGKNKLSEFAFAGTFVTEHIDYLLPFNPRGDGYGSPSDSSGGSAAAVASYEWLDASMGSDTGGSIRGPAAQNGVHGNRPTQDAVDLTGAIPLSTAMDTAGMLVRDPALWSKINKALYAGTIKEYREYPASILLDPSSAQTLSQAKDDFPEIAAAATAFLNALSELLSANVSVFSIDDAWNKSVPAAFDDPISTITDSVYRNLTTYEQWIEFGEDYVQQYMGSHDGEFPHMVPHIREGWLTANLTMNKQIHRQDLKYKASVGKWVAENFLTSNKNTCSNAIYVYFSTPSTSYKPDVSKDLANPYISELAQTSLQQKMLILELNTTINCNTTLGSEEACEESLEAIEMANSAPPSFVYPGRVASLAGLPDYAITLGSFDLGEETVSDSTLKNQSLPLAVDIMAARGCDFMILNLAEELYRAGAIRKVKTGTIA